MARRSTCAVTTCAATTRAVPVPPAAVLAVAAAVLLAGCTGAAPDSSTAPAGPDPTAAPTVSPSAEVSLPPEVSLSAEVVQYRRDAQRDVLQVKVRNDGDRPVRVTSVRLDTPTFTEPVEADKDSRISPGVAADLTLPLGGAACPGPGPAGSSHVVVLVVDGVRTEVPVAGDVLEQVATERCRVLAVVEQVSLAVAPTWQDAGQVRGEPALRGTVLATPRPGAGGLALAVEGATTLFTVAEPAAADLPAGVGAPVELPVLLTVTRCDPHAVAEDKKGYLLPVRVSVDGAEAVLVEVPVPVPERAPLQGLVDTTCGSG